VIAICTRRPPTSARDSRGCAPSISASGNFFFGLAIGDPSPRRASSLHNLVRVEAKRGTIAYRRCDTRVHRPRANFKFWKLLTLGAILYTSCLFASESYRSDKGGLIRASQAQTQGRWWLYIPTFKNKFPQPSTPHGQTSKRS
jgi:hypothetical protein